MIIGIPRLEDTARELNMEVKRSVNYRAFWKKCKEDGEIGGVGDYVKYKALLRINCTP